MKRSTILVAILAASAIALGSAGTAGAHETSAADHDRCNTPSDEMTDQGADVICSTVDQTPSGAQGLKQDGQTGTDTQGPTQVGGPDGETMANPDGTAKQSGQSGDDGQTMERAEQVSKELGQSSTDDQIIQMPDFDAFD
jgi:hypothetical protein